MTPILHSALCLELTSPVSPLDAQFRVGLWSVTNVLTDTSSSSSRLHVSDTLLSLLSNVLRHVKTLPFLYRDISHSGRL